MIKPKCKECNKSDKVVKVVYGAKVGLNDKYWECERCYAVVKRISKFKLD